MPRRPPRICNHPGCPELTQDGYCHKHRKRKHGDHNRPSAAKRGYDHRWRKFRKEYLAAHPLCVTCLEEGRATPATVVDHIEPHKGDMAKFWNMANMAAMCAPCHNSKTWTNEVDRSG